MTAAQEAHVHQVDCFIEIVDLCKYTLEASDGRLQKWLNFQFDTDDVNSFLNEL